MTAGRTAANEKRKTTATCDKCGAAKTSSEYKSNQWRNRKKKLPTCESDQDDAAADRWAGSHALASKWA